MDTYGTFAAYLVARKTNASLAKINSQTFSNYKAVMTEIELSKYDHIRELPAFRNLACGIKTVRNFRRNNSA